MGFQPSHQTLNKLLSLIVSMGPSTVIARLNKYHSVMSYFGESFDFPSDEQIKKMPSLTLE